MIRVVLVTDRACCPISETLGRLRVILPAVARGTARVQIREKDLDGGPLLAFAREVLAIAKPLGAEVWLNDRIDVALAAGVDGVQLPERGLALADARVLAGALVLGCSRHSAEAATQAARDGADLVQLGPIWATPSKLGVIEPLGPDALTLRLGVPLVAVGGIDSRERAREAAASGADAVAIIRAAWTGANPAAAIAAIVDGVEAGARRRGV